MKLPRRRFLQLAAGAAALPTLPRTANAQAYPAQPVRIVVAFAAGSGSDILARLMAQWLSERLGQQFIVDNRAGGGGNIGTEAVVKAPPDGYTLLKVVPANTVNDTLYDKLPFNFIRDVAPVAGMARVLGLVLGRRDRDLHAAHRVGGGIRVGLVMMGVAGVVHGLPCIPYGGIVQGWMTRSRSPNSPGWAASRARCVASPA